MLTPGINFSQCVVTDWLKSMESISSFVSSGRLVRKRMWLGGFSATFFFNLKKKKKKRKIIIRTQAE